MTLPVASPNVAGLMGGRHAELVQTTLIWCGTSTGSANAHSVTPEFAGFVLRGHPTFVFVAGFTNTAAATLAVGGTAAASIRKADGSVLSGGEIVAGSAYQVTYDGTYWRLVNLASSPTESIIVAAGDEASAISAGAGKVTFRMPYAFTVTAVRASLTTAQTSGSIFTIDINEAGTSILSTKLTIDNTEKSSTTAATPAVISDASLADDAEITVDVDQVGDSTARGLKVMLIGRRAS